ncbi:MAG: site-specific integrase [Lachnospiraceae bacterium]|nr:site-specific integrase [Lachnospiraceae bacterium]
MGKDLRGKELGKGIVQRKDDKKYVAFYNDSTGKRVQKRFDTLTEAKRWREKAVYEEKNDLALLQPEMTVNSWFEFWMKEKATTIKFNTKRNYTERFENDIKPVVGNMRVKDVRPIHCQAVLNRMAENEYAGSTIKQTLNTMVTMFWAAVENRLIHSTPVTKSGVKLPRDVEQNIDFLTREEQKAFLEVAKDYAYYEQFFLILQEGFRTGEIIGLKWDCVDFERREITIDKTLEYRYSTGTWRWETPKTKNGCRVVKMTRAAHDMLKELQEKPSNVNEKTPEEFKNLVFLNRTGFPTKNSTYDAALVKRCEQAGVKKISMHDLRHTMATRFCEQPMPNYKFLSKMLGHSSIKITLDLYVHLDEETKVEAIESFSDYLETI